MGINNSNLTNESGYTWKQCGNELIRSYNCHLRIFVGAQTYKDTGRSRLCIELQDDEIDGEGYLLEFDKTELKYFLKMLEEK